jgi:hypothetical protein
MNINANNNVTSLFDFATKTIIENIHRSNITALEKLPLPKTLINKLEIAFLDQLMYKDLLQRSIKFDYNLISEVTLNNNENINLNVFFDKGLAQLTQKLANRSNIDKKYGTDKRTLFIKTLCEYLANININQEIKKIISIKILRSYNATKGLYVDLLEIVIKLSVLFTETNIHTKNQLAILKNLLSIIEDKTPGRKFIIDRLYTNFRHKIKTNSLKVTIQDYNEIFKELLNI